MYCIYKNVHVNIHVCVCTRALSLYACIYDYYVLIANLEKCALLVTWPSIPSAKLLHCQSQGPGHDLDCKRKI